MSNRSIARLDPSAALVFGTTITKVAAHQGVQNAWRAAATDSSAAITAVVAAAESIAKAAGSISRASALATEAWRQHGGL